MIRSLTCGQGEGAWQVLCQANGTGVARTRGMCTLMYVFGQFY